ncbi:hypothetical protein L7F22_013952 [Adiantum nelumboides]|nr:hypothetical protein [Adiantum nelumboides]
MECISFSRSAVPPGIKLLRRLRSKHSSFESYRTSVLALTFMAYTLYHASRKPASIVKDVLQSDSTSNYFMHNPFSSWPHPGYPSDQNERFFNSPSLLDRRPYHRAPLNTNSGSVPDSFLEKGLEEVPWNGDVDTIHVKGWAPFNATSGTALLGEVDVAFLASYAIGMYLAGHLGDRLCNRWFLTVGMIGSGVCVSLFGMAYWWNIHWLGYFFIVQIIAGFFQATGWPSVVTVVARWFGKRKRGLVMGIWNAHTSVGNILGSVIGSFMLKYGWGWAFIVPGISIAFGGFLIFLFLVVDPVIVGFPSPHESSERGSRNHSVVEEHTVDPEQGLKSQPLLSNGQSSERHDDAIGFFRAWTIPGVAPFALCLFFTKLVAYTFLYWLPFYIRHTAIQGQYLSDSMSGNLSTIFDIGGVFGGIMAGYFSDKMRARAITAASFMYLSIPALLIYNVFGSFSLWLNLILMFVVGVLVNGPYALITTAVSADLGTHKSLKGNSKALATVTAIIDGTGSVGAAVGPLLTGYISQTGWRSVFYMLMTSALFAGLLLSKLVSAEVRDLKARAKAASGEI